MENWFVEGMKALISGLGTVFVVLILISIVISLLKYVNTDNTPKKNEIKPKAPKPVVEVKKQDDLELVAVITAAVAASLNTTTDKLVVQSIRRTNTRPNWNNY